MHCVKKLRQNVGSEREFDVTEWRHEQRTPTPSNNEHQKPLLCSHTFFAHVTFTCIESTLSDPHKELLILFPPRTKFNPRLPDTRTHILRVPAPAPQRWVPATRAGLAETLATKATTILVCQAGTLRKLRRKTLHSRSRWHHGIEQVFSPESWNYYLFTKTHHNDSNEIWTAQCHLKICSITNLLLNVSVSPTK